MILLIEYDTNLCNSIKKTLNKSKHKIHITDEYKDGLEYAKNHICDLVIIDISNNFEIISDVKKTHNKIKIMVISNHIDEESTTECFKLGADDYMEKPINLIEFLIRVKKLLNER